MKKITKKDFIPFYEMLEGHMKKPGFRKAYEEEMKRLMSAAESKSQRARNKTASIKEPILSI